MKIPFHEIVMRRMLCELSLVEILQAVRPDGTHLTKEELLECLETIVKAERKGIEQIGRREAGKVYGYYEGRRSSVKTVDFVLEMDFVGHYRSLEGP